ncbi:MAG: bifunctional metallophosphatase/5'-nucleotidase [Erysipelotrichaceae bacterium]
MKQLHIYFTSDLHGYMMPTDYTTRASKQMGLLHIMSHFEKDGNTLIYDGGDTIQGSPLTNYLSTQTFSEHPIAAIFNHAGYDYVTLGNHDFNYGKAYLEKYINQLDATCLCANVVDMKQTINILPFDIKTMENGLRVATIGFTTDFINRWERAEHIEDFVISDTYQAVQAAFAQIEGQADLVVGLYHGGFEYDLETHKKLSHTSENIAYQISKDFAFDILLTGHQHMAIDGMNLHGTYITQTPHNGQCYLDLMINIDDEGNKHYTSSLQPVSKPANQTMLERFANLEASVQAWLDTPVGHLDQALTPGTHLEMALHGSRLANFINQMQLSTSGADIACTSFANVIKGFERDVTVRDIMATYPYPNTLVILEVKRDIIKAALERSASYFAIQGDDISISELFLKPKVEHYNYDYFANLSYTFDLRQPIGERVTSITFKGEELTSEQTLTLCMNNYRASGAGGYEFYENCTITKEIMLEMPDIIIAYFRENPNISVDSTTYINIIK